MDNYNYMNQEMWWSESPSQNPYINDSYDYECYDNDPYVEPYDDDGWCDNHPYDESYDNGWCVDHSAQYQHDEPPYFSDDPENPKESSFNMKLDQILDMLNEINNREDTNSKSIFVIQKQIEQLAEQLNQQPPDNLLNTTQVDEVSFPCSDELFDNEMHKPSPPKVEVVMKDCVSFDDRDTKRILEIKEVVTELEKSEEALHEPVTTKVGEVILTSCSATLEKSDVHHVVVPVVVIDPECPLVETLDCPILATIFAHDSCHIEVLDLTPSGPVNHPPILGELIVINTFDDNDCEYNANILPDTARELEKCCSPCKSREAKFFEGQNIKILIKKYDPKKSLKSKIITSKFRKKKGKFPFDPGGSHGNDLTFCGNLIGLVRSFVVVL